MPDYKSAQDFLHSMAGPLKARNINFGNYVAPPAPPPAPTYMDAFAGGSALPPVQDSIAMGHAPPAAVAPAPVGLDQALAASNAKPEGMGLGHVDVGPITALPSTAAPAGAPSGVPRMLARPPEAPAPARAPGGAAGGAGGGTDPRLTALDKIEAAQGREKIAMGNMASTDRDAADAAAQIQGDFAEEQRRQATIDGARRAEEQGEIAAHVDQVRNAVDEYSKQKIDPDQFWHEKGDGARIGAALAVALNGFGNALSGRGGNEAMAMIDRAVDRNIHAQEANLQAKGQAVAMKRGVLGDMLNLTQSKEAARAAAKVAAYEQVKQQLAATASKYEAARVGPQYEKLAAGLDEAQAKARGDLVYQVQAQRAAAGAAAANARHQALKEEREYQLKLAASVNDTKRANAEVEKAGGTRDVVIDGKTYQANSEKSQEEISKASQAFDGLKQDLGELKKMRQEYGGELLDREAVARARAVAARARVRLKDAYALGALSGSDYGLLDAQITDDPLSHFRSDSSVLAGIDATLDGAEKGFQSTINARLRPGPRPAISADAQNAAVGAKPVK